MNRSVSATGRLGLIAVGALIALGAAGCTSAPSPSPSPTPSPSVPASPSQGAGTPLTGFTCDELVPTSVLDSALGGTYTLDADLPAPESGSTTAELAAAGGVVCGWTDASGTTVQLAVAIPGADVIEAGESEAARAGDETDAFGSSLTGYASGQGGTTIDVFSEGGAWLHTSSSAFTSPDVAQPIVASVMQALPSGG